MRFGLLTIFLLAGCALPTLGQSLSKDRAASAQIAVAAEFLYAYRTEQADSVLRTLQPKWGNHPGYLIFSGLVQYWSHIPISYYKADYERYKATMQKAAETADAMLEKDPNDEEATFFAMTAYSVLGRQAAEDGERFKAVSLMRKSYPGMKKGFEMQKVYPEFYFSTGLYKYYRVRYPEDHPIYKPFLAFFPNGDKAEGIRNLELAAERATYTRTEALVFLTSINLHYELNLPKGLGYAQQLVRRYPSNPVFRVLLSEALLLNGRADEVPTHATYAGRFPSPLLKAGSAAMMGWYYEKSGEADKAQAAYQDALTRSAGIKKVADNSKSISMAGLARLAAARGDSRRAKDLYNDMLDITANSLLRKEAHRYLKDN